MTAASAIITASSETRRVATRSIVRSVGPITTSDTATVPGSNSTKSTSAGEKTASHDGLIRVRSSET